MDEDRTGQGGSATDGAGAAEPEVEIVDAAPAPAAQRQPQPRPPRYEEHDAGEDYSARVRKRIGDMTGKLRREESARLAAEAEAARLRAELAHERATRFGDREKAIGGELSAAEQELARAITEGDAAKQATASRRLAELGAEKGQVAAGKTVAEQQRATAEQQAQRVTQAPQASAAVQQWIDDGNDWFLTDADMQRDAIAQHQVALAKGIKADSPEYFTFIDGRMRILHPDKFADESGQSGAEAEPAASRTPVRPVAQAPAQRRHVPGTPPPARKVQLTKDEMDVCKALGITPAKYAAERERLQRSN